MKVTVTAYLNVRVGKPSVNALCYQYIAPGSVLEVDGQLYKGDLFDGIDTWLKDEANNYYWSGGVNHAVSITELLNLSEEAPDEKINFTWFSSLGIKNVWDKFNEKGDAVTIAVLDTGYNKNNSDIETAVTENEIIIGADKYPGINLVINDQSSGGHGSRCASLIGARNKLKWIIGIAPKCKLIAGKISINREIRDFSYILDGIEWAVKQGADIISVSYAIEFTPEIAFSWNEKFEKLLLTKPVLIFAAAGNSNGIQMTGERYPASFPKCISVGAIDERRNLSALTVLSSKTVLHAPGINIESFGLKDTPDAQSGTSFSTPIVAAIAGLAISHLRKKGKIIDRDDLLAKMINTGDNIPGFENKTIINIEKLFDKL